MVVPVALEVLPYAQQVCEKMRSAGFYSDVDDSRNQFPKKIRDAQLAQYNFILVVGEQEVKVGGVNVRTRDNQVHGLRSVDGFIAELKYHVANFH